SSCMKSSATLLPLILVLAFSSVALGQTTNRRTTTNGRKTPAATQTQPAPQPQAVTQPTATPTAAPARPATPMQIVVVNGQTFGTTDFEPALREQLETVEQKIAEARLQVLDLQINTTLLQIEAKKRHIDTHALYETEVSNRATMPTPAQIKKFIDEN